MATNRYINTNFWRDTYVIDLDPSEKLLFIYLLTNPNTNIAGIYEISVRQIAFDTGYDSDMVKKILARFERDGKVVYKRGWLALTNWIKHQSINPKVASGIQRIIEDLPKWLYKELIEPEDPQTSLLEPVENIDYDSLSKPIALNLTKLNSIKLNGTEPDKPVGDSKNWTKEQKRNYAIAMQKEREQKARAEAAKSRASSKPTQPLERKWR